MSSLHGRVIVVPGFGEVRCQCPGCPECKPGATYQPPGPVFIRCLDCARQVMLRQPPGSVETIRVVDDEAGQ